MLFVGLSFAAVKSAFGILNVWSLEGGLTTNLDATDADRGLSGGYHLTQGPHADHAKVRCAGPSTKHSTALQARRARNEGVVGVVVGVG